jgi:RNase adapter protein RapZ
MSGSIFYLITGMAGAGKSTVLNGLEDAGFFCVDNLPVGLFDKFFELLTETIETRSRVALATDIRSGEQFSSIMNSLKILGSHDISYHVIFLNCEIETLVKRFKETRRRHPLYKGSLMDAIKKERRLLSSLLASADIVLDTTHLKTRDLSRKIQDLLRRDESADKLVISLNSFGFKHGLPKDADMVFDVRFLENPYYDEKLRGHRGFEPEVMDYVLNKHKGNLALEKIQDCLEALIPYFVIEGRNHLSIALGCTGGHHRSVACVEKLYESLSSMGDVVFTKFHRDC